MELSGNEAMNLIEGMRQKIALVKGLHGKMILGVAAKKIESKDEIRSRGFYTWDLES